MLNLMEIFTLDKNTYFKMKSVDSSKIHVCLHNHSLKMNP